MTKTLEPDQYAERLGSWLVNKELRLWYLGNPELLSMPMACVIGTRDVTEQGKARTRKVTRLLVEQGFCIVSGLAKGVDTVAHETALQSGGRTIAVMGTPIDKCYPKENESLKVSIAAQGLVLSQFAMGERVFQSNFPRRNALMAALSDVTVVTEAGEKSGTRHQVRVSISMARPVGFLASMVDTTYPWVAAALASGNGFIIREPHDLLERTDMILQQGFAPSSEPAGPPRQLTLDLSIPQPIMETVRLVVHQPPVLGSAAAAPSLMVQPASSPARKSTILRGLQVAKEWVSRQLGTLTSIFSG
jgi:DNA processing protein